MWLLFLPVQREECLLLSHSGYCKCLEIKSLSQGEDWFFTVPMRERSLELCGHGQAISLFDTVLCDSQGEGQGFSFPRITGMVFFLGGKVVEGAVVMVVPNGMFVHHWFSLSQAWGKNRWSGGILFFVSGAAQLVSNHFCT